MIIFSHRKKHQIIWAFFYCAAIIILCSLSVWSQTKEAYKFEELVTDAGSCEHISHDIDYFALELGKNPTAKGYIIFYGGKTYDFYEKPTVRLPRHGEAEFRANLAEGRLKWLKTDPNSYTIVNGGYRERFTFEFWLVPDGAEFPKATPTIEATEIKFRKGKIKNTENIWSCVF